MVRHLDYVFYTIFKLNFSGNLIIHDFHNKNFYQFRSEDYRDHSFSGPVVHHHQSKSGEIIHVFFGIRNDKVKSWILKMTSG